jgi:hypothetical protein
MPQFTPTQHNNLRKEREMKKDFLLASYSCYSKTIPAKALSRFQGAVKL